MITYVLAIGLNVLLYVYYYQQMRSLNKGVQKEMRYTGIEAAEDFAYKHNLHLYIRQGKKSQYQWTKKAVLLKPEHFQIKTEEAVAVATHECAHALQAKRKTILSMLRVFFFVFRLPALIAAVVCFFTPHTPLFLLSLFVIWGYYVVAYLHEREANRYVTAFLANDSVFDPKDQVTMIQVLNKYQTSYAVNAASMSSLLLLFLIH